MSPDPLDYEADPRPKLRPGPVTPINDLTPFVRHLDHCVVWKPGALRCNCGLADAFDALDAALASPEGVVTLPKLGQRVRITTDDGMDHVGEVIRYGDPEGNVRTLFMVALDDGSSGYFLDEPSWHWTLVPHRPEDTKGGDDEAALARMDALVAFTPDPPEDPT